MIVRRSFRLLALFAVSVSGLTIDPDIDEIIISSGGEYSINCSSSAPISWHFETIPARSEEDFEINSIVEHDIYTSKLFIRNATYLHTGQYFCFSNETGTETGKSIYIFVKDVNNPLVDDPISGVIHLRGYLGDSFIIPCKPTSPDVNVTLCSSNGCEEKNNYDPRYGFKIPVLKITDIGHHLCKGQYKNQTKQIYYDISFSSAKKLEKPKILKPDGPVFSHQDLKIECRHSIQEQTNSCLYWLTCPFVEKKTRSKTTCLTPDFCDVKACEKTKYQKICFESVTSKDPGKPRYITQQTLVIRNVTKSDEKEYTCVVTDMQDQYNASYNLTVIDADLKYLNLSMDYRKVMTSFPAPNASWSVIIHANPRPNISWYNPKGQLMTHSESHKYMIDNKPQESKVIINDLSINDSGVYRCVANNGEYERELKVTLFVEDLPHLKLSSKTYYSVNEEVYLQAEVTGWQFPNLSCSFISENSSYENGVNIELSSDHPSGVKKKYNITFEGGEMGNISCTAKNNLGNEKQMVPIVVTDIDGVFDLWGPTSYVMTSDNVTIGCGVSKYFYDLLEWSVDNMILFNNSSGITIIENRTEFSIKSFLSIQNIQLNHSGSYICKAESISNRSVIEKKIDIDVRDMMPPTIIGEPTNETQLNVGETFTAICNVTGIPQPSITWYKDNMILNINRSLIKLNANNTLLEIPKVIDENAGTYECVARSRSGNASRQFTLLIRGSYFWVKLWIIVSVCILVLVIILLVLYCRIRREQNLHKQQKKAILSNFTEGQVDSLNPELNVHDQADLLPYDEKWEFPRDKLKLGKQLGSGAFGVVLKAEAFGLNNSEEPMIVAVKMVKKNSNLSLIKALTSELKLMANLGQHLNVVNLIGACTKNIHSGELLVLVEYCRFGNLHNYLLRHRDAFINQINPKTGVIEMVTRNKVLELAYFSGPSNCMETNNSQASDYSNFQTGNTEMTSLSTPIGDDGYLVSKEPEWRSYYQGDYKTSSVRPICTQDLLCWSYQVARGMEYLASRKVLHGDLAARNILLAEGNIVKICDFGLARSIYSGNYCKKGDDPLPVKWMSIEALRDRIFSTQSDIWAFGIVLWEMFALAKTPYPGIQFGPKFFNKLLDGYRMEKPEYATDEIYKLMQDCWFELPMSRPSFTECSERIGNMLEESVKQHYIDLNDPYLKLNEQMPSQSDYLSMLNAPTFTNFSSVASDCDHTEGYVNMRKNPTETGDALELKPMLIDGNNHSLDIKSFLNPGYEGFNNVKDITYMNIPQQPAIQV